MELCKTSNISIFTFIMLAIWNFAHVLTAAVYIAWRGSNEKVCKMMTSHFRILLWLQNSNKFSYFFSWCFLLVNFSSLDSPTLRQTIHSLGSTFSLHPSCQERDVTKVQGHHWLRRYPAQGPMGGRTLRRERIVALRIADLSWDCPILKGFQNRNSITW